MEETPRKSNSSSGSVNAELTTSPGASPVPTIRGFEKAAHEGEKFGTFYPPCDSLDPRLPHQKATPTALNEKKGTSLFAWNPFLCFCLSCEIPTARGSSEIIPERETPSVSLAEQ